MNEVLTTSKKVRIIALGCGAQISSSLMRPGSSQWLHSINLPYDMEEINKLGGADTKFVSQERVDAILSNLKPILNVVDIIVSAKLVTKNEREGRDNVAYFAFRDFMGVEHDYFEFIVKDRVQQEIQIVSRILAYLASVKQQDTRVVYPGSFNPMHDGHIQVMLASAGISNSPVTLEMTTVHVDKDNGSDVDSRMKQAREYCDKLGVGVDGWITDQPKYRGKYDLLMQKLSTDDDIVFLAGDDVWQKWSDSLKADFKGIDNVQFLIVSRVENKPIDERESHPLLHPLSWTKQMSDETLAISSSEIRALAEAGKQGEKACAKFSSEVSGEDELNLGPLDVKLNNLRYCIARGHDEDALQHLFDLHKALLADGIPEGHLTIDGDESKLLWNPESNKSPVERLHKENQRLKTVIKQALTIKELWLRPPVDEDHDVNYSEVAALRMMCTEMQDALGVCECGEPQMITEQNKAVGCCQQCMPF